MTASNIPTSQERTDSPALQVRLILSMFLLILVSMFESCDKDTPNIMEERILTHEDSLSLGLISDVPSDTTTTQPDTPPPPKESIAMIDGINYKFNEDNFTAQVTWKEGDYSGNIVIPDVVHYNNGVYSVIAIGEAAFWRSNLKKVVIKGENLKKIETHAFAQSGLSGGINIPNSVTEIGWRAFWNCGLTSITLPNSLTEIGKEVFRATPLKEVKLPDNLEKIGEAAFLSCPIESITLPATIKEIGPEAFTSGDFRKILCYAIDVPKAEYSSFPFRLKNWRGWYNQNIYLYVPKQSISLYRETEPWKYCVSVSAIEDGLLW